MRCRLCSQWRTGGRSGGLGHNSPMRAGSLIGGDDLSPDGQLSDHQTLNTRKLRSHFKDPINKFTAIDRKITEKIAISSSTFSQIDYSNCTEITSLNCPCLQKCLQPSVAENCQYFHKPYATCGKFSKN